MSSTLKVGNVFHLCSVGRGTSGPSLQGTKGLGNQDALVNLLDTMEIHLLALFQRHCPPLVWELLPSPATHTQNPESLYLTEHNTSHVTQPAGLLNSISMTGLSGWLARRRENIFQDSVQMQKYLAKPKVFTRGEHRHATIRTISRGRTKRSFQTLC